MGDPFGSILWKRGHRVQSWRRRYFVLEGTSLAYFTSREHMLKGKKPKGIVQVVAIKAWKGELLEAQDSAGRSNSSGSSTGNDFNGGGGAGEAKRAGSIRMRRMAAFAKDKFPFMFYTTEVSSGGGGARGGGLIRRKKGVAGGASRDTYYVYAESAEDRDQWFSVVTAVVHQLGMIGKESSIPLSVLSVDFVGDTLALLKHGRHSKSASEVDRIELPARAKADSTSGGTASNLNPVNAATRVLGTTRTAALICMFAQDLTVASRLACVSRATRRTCGRQNELLWRWLVRFAYIPDHMRWLFWWQCMESHLEGHGFGSTVHDLPRLILILEKLARDALNDSQPDALAGLGNRIRMTQYGELKSPNAPLAASTTTPNDSASEAKVAEDAIDGAEALARAAVERADSSTSSPPLPPNEGGGDGGEKEELTGGHTFIRKDARHSVRAHLDRQEIIRDIVQHAVWTNLTPGSASQLGAAGLGDSAHIHPWARCVNHGLDVAHTLVQQLQTSTVRDLREEVWLDVVRAFGDLANKRVVRRSSILPREILQRHAKRRVSKITEVASHSVVPTTELEAEAGPVPQSGRWAGWRTSLMRQGNGPDPDRIGADADPDSPAEAVKRSDVPLTTEEQRTRARSESRVDADADGEADAEAQQKQAHQGGGGALARMSRRISAPAKTAGAPAESPGTPPQSKREQSVSQASTDTPSSTSSAASSVDIADSQLLSMSAVGSVIADLAGGGGGGMRGTMSPRVQQSDSQHRRASSGSAAILANMGPVRQSTGVRRSVRTRCSGLDPLSPVLRPSAVSPKNSRARAAAAGLSEGPVAAAVGTDTEEDDPASPRTSTTPLTPLERGAEGAVAAEQDGARLSGAPTPPSSGSPPLSRPQGSGNGARAWHGTESSLGDDDETEAETDMDDDTDAETEAELTEAEEEDDVADVNGEGDGKAEGARSALEQQEQEEGESPSSAATDAVAAAATDIDGDGEVQLPGVGERETVVAQNQRGTRTSTTDSVLNRSASHGEIGSSELFYKQHRLAGGLLALAAHQAEDVGYCQGMDRVMIHLMRAARCASSQGYVAPSEIPLRWALDDLRQWVCVLLFNSMMTGLQLNEQYLRGGLQGLRLRVYQFDSLLQAFKPELRAHLESQGVITEVYVIGWIQTLFLHIEAMPAETLDRIWTVLLWEQDWRVVLQVALAIMELSEPHLLDGDIESIVRYFNEFPNEAVLEPQVLLPVAWDIWVNQTALTALTDEFMGVEQQRSR